MGIDLSPVWVLSFLEAGEQDIFAKKVDRQFNAFTGEVLDINPEKKGAKWWAVSHLSIDHNIEALFERKIPRSLLEAYPVDETALFRGNSITLVVYAKPEIYKEDTFKERIRDIVAKFPDIVKYSYLLLEIKENQGDNADFATIFTDNLFDGIVITDASNMNPNNTEGYRDLYQNTDLWRENIYARASQIVLNLAVGHQALLDKVQSGKKVFAASGFSLFFEKEVFKSQLSAEHLALPILKSFFTARDREYWQESHINKGVERAMEELTTESLYKKTVHVFDDKFKQVNNFFTHKVSPWSLFSTALVETYFKGELKSLLRKLVGYGRLLDAHLSSQFRRHLLGRKEKVQQESIAFLHDGLKALWVEDNLKESDPIDLRQFQYNLEQIEAGLKQAENSLNSPEEYYKIALDHPPLTPPAQAYDEYKERMDARTETSGVAGVSDSGSVAEKEEENLMNQLRKKLEFHPIPLSLLVRAAIMGMVLSITLYGFIVAFSPNFIINTSFFEQGNGRYLWFAGVFILPILLALFKYGWSTLNKINRLKQKYLGWVFYRIQLKLMDDSRAQVQMLVDELQNECQRIKTNLENALSLMGMAKDLEEEKNEQNNNLSALANSIERIQSVFPESYFQQNILIPIDVTSESHYIQLPDLSAVMVMLSASETISITALDEKHKYTLLRDFLVTRKNYKALFESIAGDETNFSAFINKVQADFMEKLTVPIEHIGEFSFTRKALDVIKARAHPSAYKYSASNENVTRFRFSIADASKLPEVLIMLLNENNAMTAEVLPLTDDAGRPINNGGFIQVCDFYRLSNTDDLKSKL